MTQASRDCEISNPSAIKYALDNGKPTIKRKSDKKIEFQNEKYFFYGGSKDSEEDSEDSKDSEEDSEDSSESSSESEIKS